MVHITSISLPLPTFIWQLNHAIKKSGQWQAFLLVLAFLKIWYEAVSSDVYRKSTVGFFNYRNITNISPFYDSGIFLWQLHYYNADQYFHVRQTKLHWGCFHFISVIYQYFMKLEHILLNGWLRGNLLYWRVTWSDYTPNHNIQREITRSFCKGLLLSHFKMQYSDKRKSFQDQCGLVTFQESVDFTGYEIHASWSHQLQSLNGDHLWDRKRAPRR